MKILFERYRQLDSFRSKFFAKAISRFESFSLNEYDLRILPTAFMIVVFDLRDKELKYAKELLLIHHKISEQNSARLQDMRV